MDVFVGMHVRAVCVCACDKTGERSAMLIRHQWHNEEQEETTITFVVISKDLEEDDRNIDPGGALAFVLSLCLGLVEREPTLGRGGTAGVAADEEEEGREAEEAEVGGGEEEGCPNGLKLCEEEEDVESVGELLGAWIEG